MIVNDLVEDILKKFIIDLKNILNENILSVMIYGSSVWDDFSFGYSDIDFLVVTKDDLSIKETKKMTYLFRKYRLSNVNSKLLEGYLISYDLLVGNQSKGLQIFWNGIREHITNHLSIDTYTMFQIKEISKVIYGEEIRQQLKPIKRTEMISHIENYLVRSRSFIKATSDIHCIDWLFVFSSMIYFVINNKMRNKSHCALWVFEHINCEWKHIIPKCVAIRQNPKLFTILEYLEWVKTIGPELNQVAAYLEKIVKNNEEGEFNEYISCQ